MIRFGSCSRCAEPTAARRASAQSARCCSRRAESQGARAELVKGRGRASARVVHRVARRRRRPAAAGAHRAAWNLGRARGDQVAPKAARFYRLAAEQGYAAAQTNLGYCYERGEGVAQDWAEAVRYYRLAAEQGQADGQCYLGLCYERGEGVAQDYKTAAKWYTRAAEQGNKYAQNNLGVMYLRGQGVAQDYVKAHMWFNISAIDGSNEKATQNRDDIAKKMTPIQIARAQDLASKCVAQSFKNCGP